MTLLAGIVASEVQDIVAHGNGTETSPTVRTIWTLLGNLIPLGGLWRGGKGGRERRKIRGMRERQIEGGRQGRREGEEERRKTRREEGRGG